MIIAKIDVTKIDKNKLFRGQKGVYLDIALAEREDEYGNDYIIFQGTSKEERERGERGAILGNAKKVYSSPKGSEHTSKEEEKNDIEDQCPF